MKLKKTMDWTNLPSHIFQNIFQFCPLSDLKVVSLVCKNWYEEVGDSWSPNFILNCCYFETDKDLQVLAESRRQYQSVGICHCHIHLGKSIISIIKARRLRKQCRVFKIVVDGVFYTTNTPFEKVVDLLNQHGRDITVLEMSGLNDENTDDSLPLVLKKLPNVRHFELKGLLDLRQRNLEVLYDGFENVRTLKLNLNRLSVWNRKLLFIENFLVNNLELENLTIELEIENYSAELFLDSVKHLRHLKNLSIIFSDRLHKSLDLNVLKRNKQLETLRFKACYISNSDMMKIPKQFTNLRDVRFYLDKNVDEHSLRAIGGLPHLESMELVFDAKFPSDFENWFGYVNKNLKSLKLVGCKRFYEYVVSKTLKERIDFAKSNPLRIDPILKNLPNLEYLSIQLASLKLDNPEGSAFLKLKTTVFEDCYCQENTTHFFQCFKSPTLTFLKTDMLGMKDETVDIILNNFKKIKYLHLTSEDKLGVGAMQSLNRAKLESVTCYNLSLEMGKELLNGSNNMKKAELKFNIPQMDVQQRIQFEKEHKDIILTANSFDHMKAHQFLTEICQVFDPPLEKSTNQGWLVGSHCYRTYKLLRNGLNIDIAMKYNTFLEN